jgi:hypothetical protein
MGNIRVKVDMSRLTMREYILFGEFGQSENDTIRLLSFFNILSAWLWDEIEQQYIEKEEAMEILFSLTAGEMTELMQEANKQVEEVQQLDKMLRKCFESEE